MKQLITDLALDLMTKEISNLRAVISNLDHDLKDQCVFLKLACREAINAAQPRLSPDQYEAICGPLLRVLGVDK